MPRRPSIEAGGSEGFCSMVERTEDPTGLVASPGSETTLQEDLETIG